MRPLEGVAVGVVFDSCLGLGGRRGRRGRKRERGFEKHPSTQAIDKTRSLRRSDLTCGLYLRSHSISALVRTREQSTRSPSSSPCLTTSTSSRSWDGTTRREEFKLFIAQLGSDSLTAASTAMDSALIRSLFSLRWRQDMPVDSWPGVLWDEGETFLCLVRM